MAIAGSPDLSSSYGASGPSTPNSQVNNLFGYINQNQGNPSAFGNGGNGLPTTPAAGLAPPQQAQPNADFMTPQMQAYVDQFHQSQAAQQQAINAGLMQAMQGLGQRRDAAAGVVANLPAQYSHIQNMVTSAAAGPQQAVNPQAEAQQYINANNKQNAVANAAIGESGHLMQPLMNAAVAADYSKGADTLNNQHMQNQSALSEQNAQFAENMLMKQADFANAQTAAKQAQAAQNAAELQREQYGTSERQSTEQWQADQNKQQAANAPALNPNLAAKGLTQGQVADVKNSQAYGTYSAQLNSASAKDAPGQAAMIRSYLSQVNPNLLAVLEDEHGTVFANAKMPSQASSNGGWGNFDLKGSILDASNLFHPQFWR